MRPVDPLFLGIDVGTSSCKVAVFGTDGTVRGEGTVSYHTEFPRPGWSEQDAELYWQGTVAAVQQAVAAEDRGRIAGIGCCGQTPTLVLVDGAGAPVAPAITWQDTRAHAEAEMLDAFASPEQWDGWLQLRLPRNASFPPARLLWLKRHDPDALERTAVALQPKDFVNLQLTGIAGSDYWSSKGLVRLHTGQVIDQYADLLGIDPHIAPICRYPQQPLGPLSSAAAAVLGLTPGVPVAAGWSDAMCGMLGTGALSGPGNAFDLSGTSEIVGITTGGSHPADGGILEAPVLDTDLRIVYGPTQSSGSAVSWLRERFNVDTSLLSDSATRATLINESDRLVFLPYLQGERAPLWQPNLRATFAGLEISHGPAHLLLAVFEGVAFSIRHVLETAEAGGYLRAEPVRVAGGGARLAHWNQIKADALQRVLLPTKVTEAGALGAAILGALAAGSFTSLGEAVDAMVLPGEPVIPDPAQRERYERLYHAYRVLSAQAVNNDSTSPRVPASA